MSRMDEFERRLTEALADEGSPSDRSRDLAAGARRVARARRGRRRTTLGVVAASTLVVAVVGGQWWSEAGQGGDPGPGETGRGEEPVAPGPRVTCVQDGAWPVAAMAGGEGKLSAAEDARVRGAFADLLDEAPLDAPPELRSRGALKAHYVVLLHGPDDLVLGLGEWSEQGPGAQAMVLSLARHGDSWQPDGWGDCQLRVVTRPGQERVELTAPTGGVDTTGRTITLLATERQCSSARDVTAYLSEPEVVETDDEVRVVITAEEVTGAATCPGNPPVEVALTLDRPLGSRRIVDAGAWPPVTLETAQP
ncbi:hypothetical protein [Nocardioides daejeonensis]|uniref:hypothetical protein n=1 Tax=Nocardioides daejeonensis TaxID=1046556 RepID=UPI0013A55398|nr:hypothetical protein [Nocardioides daejeonensis]